MILSILPNGMSHTVQCANGRLLTGTKDDATVYMDNCTALHSTRNITSKPHERSRTCLNIKTIFSGMGPKISIVGRQRPYTEMGWVASLYWNRLMKSHENLLSQSMYPCGERLHIRWIHHTECLWCEALICIWGLYLSKSINWLINRVYHCFQFRKDIFNYQLCGWWN